MGLISIKKHLDVSPEAAKLFEAYLQIIEETLALSRDRMRAPTSKQEAGEDLSKWMASLRKQKDGEGVDRARADILRMLNGRWDAMETYLRERESELTAIIALLAETAAKLDESNRDYYRNLHRSVETLKAIGEIDDISVLRRALSEHLKQLKKSVSTQETVTQQTIGDLRAGLDQARSKAKAVGQLVSTAPLSRFPSRRHAESYLGELLDRQQAFAFAMVRVERVDAIARRYGDESAAEVLQAFSDILRDELPPSANIYSWEDATFVAVADRMESSELSDCLARLAEQLRSKPIEIGDGRRRPAPIEPTYAVRDARDSPNAAKIVATIDSFCQAR